MPFAPQGEKVFHKGKTVITSTGGIAYIVPKGYSGLDSKLDTLALHCLTPELMVRYSCVLFAK
jgi:hypothetical protein